MNSRLPLALDLRELIRARDAEIRARLLDPRHGIAQIVVLFERGARELLQLFVFENLEPLKIRKRRGLRGGQRIRRTEVLRAVGTVGRT